MMDRFARAANAASLTPSCRDRASARIRRKAAATMRSFPPGHGARKSRRGNVPIGKAPYCDLRWKGVAGAMTQQPGMIQATAIDAAKRWLHAIAQSSTLLGLAMIGLTWMSLAFHVEIERDTAEHAAIENSRNLARAFEAHLSQSLSDVDRMLDVMRAYYLRDPAHFDFDVWSEGTRLLDKAVVQLSIIGPDGRIRASTIPGWSPVDLSDREHFRVHIDAKEDKLYISKPVLGRVSGNLTIQLSRRITRADGSFDGVIVANLDPSYFARLYDSIEVGADGYIRIIGTDGVIRAAGGSIREEPGRSLASTQLFTRLASQPTGAFYTSSPLTDNVTRLVVYRAVKDLPLVVTIGRSSKEIFAPLTAKQRSYNFVASLLTVLILAAVAHSVHGRLQLDAASEELRLQNARFHAALNNMPHGVSMYDRDGGFVVSNNRYLEMYGLPPEAAEIGTSFVKMLAHRMELDGTDGDPDEEARGLMARLALGKPVFVRTKLADGRIIAITNQPMADGGFVATHEDITGRQRAERELRNTKNFLDTVIENVPMPLVVKDPQTQKFVFVNQAYEEFIGKPRSELIGQTVHDIYPRESAQYVVERDLEAAEAARTGTGLVKAEFPAMTSRGVRIINTLRLVAPGDEETPGLLITVFEDVTDRRKVEEKIVHMAMHDALTGLSNRADFQSRLREALARVARGGQLAVLCLDLDNFKNINDALGHAVGDDLLRSVADRLQRCVREVDLVARLGGDEFAIIQNAIDSPGAAAALAQRIRDDIGKPFDLGGVQAVVNASMGIAVAPTDSTDPEQLLKQADMALYAAKAEGRGVYRFFQSDMDARMKLRLEIEQELRDAIENGELRLHYQPVVDVMSGEISGMEALLRWPHARRGLVPPNEFVSIAEESGLIIPLGEWVLRKALADAARWPENVRIAVNLSPVQFRSRQLSQVVIAACAAARVAPARLELEVTEAAFLAATKEVLATLDQLRHLGVKIVMDDFGTGYSSLNYLRRFPFDKIKIDRSFVRDLSEKDSLSAVIVEAVVRLAHALEVPTTAEGVETVEQLDIIRAAGVTEMQGFLYSPARPAEEIDAMFAAQSARKTTAA
jgi:diguanylate cyclase (GGDEF)-like protein/PAS domain S-box-containing protein